MPRRLLLTSLILLLASCQNNAPMTPSPTLHPISTAPAADNPLPQAVPSVTAVAEGWYAGEVPTPLPHCPEQSPWFFDNPANECAATVLNTWAVMQRFENGAMFWFQDDGQTYIFLDDRSLFKPYEEVNDPAGLGIPQPDPNIVPPPGLYQPELGFAKFWRGLVPGSEWVRDQLGWALAPEEGYSALWQCNTATDSSARCYFTGPRDEIISITNGDGHYWNYWQGPVR